MRRLGNRQGYDRNTSNWAGTVRASGIALFLAHLVVGCL